MEHYARIVKEKAILRSLIHSAAAIQEQALAAGDDADTILDRAESAIFQLAEDRVRAGLIGIKDVVRDGFERLEKIFSEGRRITGLATGYAGLDNETAGSAAFRADYPGGAAFDGQNGAGAEHRENVALRQQTSRWPSSAWKCRRSRCLLRMLASEARVDAHKFRTGHMNRDDWGKITGTLATLGEAPHLDR